MKKLDELYGKDKDGSALESYEFFEKYQRPSDMDINKYINAFERLY